jgi:hypothetical protein
VDHGRTQTHVSIGQHPTHRGRDDDEAPPGTFELLNRTRASRGIETVKSATQVKRINPRKTPYAWFTSPTLRRGDAVAQVRSRVAAQCCTATSHNGTKVKRVLICQSRSEKIVSTNDSLRNFKYSLVLTHGRLS